MRNIVWLVLFFCIANPVWAQVYQAHTHVRLVSEQDAVAPGGTFWVGLDLVPDAGWHLYWQNPGDAGLAPKIKWDLAEGIKAGGIQWPYPKRLDAGPLTSFGYEKEVFLLVPVSVDRNFQSGNADLHAVAEWLTCREECIPGKADFNLSLPVMSSGIKFNGLKGVFDQTRQGFPKAIAGFTSRAYLTGDRWHLDIHAPVQRQGEIFFFPFRDDVIEHAAPQPVKMISDGYEVTLVKSHIYQGTNALSGIAVNSAGWDQEGKIKSIPVQAPIERTADKAPWWLACLFALMGGLVLNLMPCVLPVLSIKVLHLAERHPDKKIAFSHSLVYALGILVSVWALAFLLFILKSAGQLAGWGFQFQSPVFVMAVALVLFVLALNLFGAFEFSAPSISGVPMPQGYPTSFISGIVTTIVASPCTAPFMGTALTLAISQPGTVGFGIFTCLGLGLALPFIVLSAYPRLLSFVPKPGPWMIYLKKALGLILLGCVCWLLWVFGIQTGLIGLSKSPSSADGIQWQAYSATGVSQARQSGHGVFLDFTAAWCINCQVNDRLVLQNKNVVQAFKEQGIVAFKGDWAKYDPAITQALASFGRDSIPVYVYYPPGSGSPVILPQVITPQTILKCIHNNNNS